MIEGLKSEIRKLFRIISLFLTLALQSFNKNQSKMQKNVKNGEKMTNHKKSSSIHRDLNPGPSNRVGALWQGHCSNLTKTGKWPSFASPTYMTSAKFWDSLTLPPLVLIWNWFILLYYGQKYVWGSDFFSPRFPFVPFLYTNHVLRNEERYIFQKIIKTSRSESAHIQ